MDVKKQVEYWSNGGQEDLDAAKSLLEKGHSRHALFFAHLAVEKGLKAHVSRTTGQIPPKIHNLIRLAELAGLSLSEPQDRFLRTMNMYQLEGRYPDTAQAVVSESEAATRLEQAGEFFTWLTSKL